MQAERIAIKKMGATVEMNDANDTIVRGSCVRAKARDSGTKRLKKTDGEATRGAVWSNRPKLGISYRVFFKRVDRQAGT